MMFAIALSLECRKGWTTRGNSCYFYIDSWVTYRDAHIDCLRRNAKVVDFKTDKAAREILQVKTDWYTVWSSTFEPCNDWGCAKSFCNVYEEKKGLGSELCRFHYGHMCVAPPSVVPTLTTAAPSTDAPVTDAPSTVIPATETPSSTEAPSTTTASPTTEAPFTCPQS